MTAVITPSNLTPGTAAPPATPVLPIQWAVAQGTSDAIQAVYPVTNLSLTDGLLLAFRATAANMTVAPTFSPDGLPAAPITKGGGQVLSAGDIPHAGYEATVRYNLGFNVWELLFQYPP